MLNRIVASVAFLASGSITVSAAPLVAPIAAPSQIILVSGGCGFAFHRDPFGVCVPNRRAFYGDRPEVVRLPPPCPRGYHRDPDPARRLCYPNL